MYNPAKLTRFAQICMRPGASEGLIGACRLDPVQKYHFRQNAPVNWREYAAGPMWMLLVT
ncbi:hypothetical protein [Mucilaginibacter sp. CSA2-8R]|uniref:hypothetical protein n=1 Tax=Mucilaginibacter sp. CSA2-8R TaxID=3141542 RepID=UPI00315C8C9C